MESIATFVWAMRKTTRRLDRARSLYHAPTAADLVSYLKILSSCLLHRLNALIVRWYVFVRHRTSNLFAIYCQHDHLGQEVPVAVH